MQQEPAEPPLCHPLLIRPAACVNLGASVLGFPYWPIGISHWIPCQPSVMANRDSSPQRTLIRERLNKESQKRKRASRSTGTPLRAPLALAGGRAELA